MVRICKNIFQSQTFISLLTRPHYLYSIKIVSFGMARGLVVFDGMLGGGSGEGLKGGRMLGGGTGPKFGWGHVW